MTTERPSLKEAKRVCKLLSTVRVCDEEKEEIKHEEIEEDVDVDVVVDYDDDEGESEYETLSEEEE